MPRQSRLDAPGVLHHVMGRGIERRKIFLSDIDHNDFIGRLSALAQSGAFEIYAWVLMPNHFHLLCKTKKLPLASSMRRILTGYYSNSDDEKEIWELVYPVLFLKRLVDTCMNKMEEYLRENGINPYMSYTFGTYWID